MKVFSAQQMREFDRAAIEDYGIPSIVLMENAALRVVEFLEAKFAPLSEKKIVVLCGKGNNGGDGLAIARHLFSCGASVYVYLACAEQDLKSDAAIQLRAYKSGKEKLEINMGLEEIDGEDELFIDKMVEADLILDALLGTGFKGEIENPRYVAALNYLHTTWCPKVSVDTPSGLNADEGSVSSLAAESDYTVTFAAPKRGFFVRDGIEKSGEIWMGEIGTFDNQIWETETGIETINLGEAKFLLPHRNADAHKGNAGRALIIGGSFGMSGSICLAARAALASGAGLVSAALPAQILPMFATSVLEAVSHPLANDESGHLLSRAADQLPDLWKGVQAVALGPGLGRTDETFEFARRVVRECPVPLIVDADALHALPAIIDDVKARKAATILTPHPGEMGVLMDCDAKAVNENRFEMVKACADKYGAVTVLKGARTLVCDSSGEIWVNLTGNAGMATGGAGDVLTGTIAGLLAQLRDADNATKLGVYLHGLACDVAARTRGNGLVAGDIAAHLPNALVEVESREVERINGRLRKLE